MKKAIQILFLIFFSLAVFGQEKMDTTISGKRNKWELGITGGTVCSFPTFHFIGNKTS